MSVFGDQYKLDLFLLSTVYDRDDFDADQINEMELGLYHSDTISYANPYLSADEMRQIREGNKVKIKLNLKVAN